MTVVHPRVSTDGNFLTIAFNLDILLDPRDKHVVITAGSPFLKLLLHNNYSDFFKT
jgi:hypothetical protein